MTARPTAGRHDPLAEYRAVCRTCHAPILWAHTADNELMPVDEKPAHDGNLIVYIEDKPTNARLLAGVLTRAQADGARSRDVRLYRSHFVSCPDAARHRRARSKTRRWRRT